MAKLQVQAFAKIPNEYISIERSRSLSLLEEKLVYMLINAMQKRWESTKKLEQIDFKFIASGTVSFTDFRRIMQISSKDNKELLASLKVLFNQPSNDENSFTVCSKIDIVYYLMKKKKYFCAMKN